MHVYLPIAELSVNVLVILGLGAAVGFLSGLFGVGGGFLMTPLLIFLGIPPAVAVGTQANQIVAASVSGLIGHWRRGNVDVAMGLVLLVGGVAGSGAGVWLFRLLKGTGQIDFAINALYVVFLGAIGILMAAEAGRTMVRRHRTGGARRGKLHEHNRLHGLPFKLRFRKSKLYISALLPLAVGFVVGVLAAIMGVGGGIVMVPAMIYLLGMPTSVVVGTSLFQIIFVTAAVTIMHAWFTQTVDVLLALLLLVGGVIGAQYGTRFEARLRGEQLRGLMALLVLGLAIKLLFDLSATPDDIYSLDQG